VRPLILVAIVLNLAYWVLGQGFGGIFMGNATDPNAGLPFVLLAIAVATVLAPPTAEKAQSAARSNSVPGAVR
jgi:hypothetical protein